MKSYVFFSFFFCPFLLSPAHMSVTEKRVEQELKWFLCFLLLQIYLKSIWEFTVINYFRVLLDQGTNLLQALQLVLMTWYQSKLHYLSTLTGFVAVFVCVCIQTQHGIGNKSAGWQRNPNKNNMRLTTWNPNSNGTVPPNDALGLFSLKAFLTFWIDLFLHCQASHH